MRRVLLAAAGSGGHLYPALSVAEALRRRQPGMELLVVTCERGEAIVRDAGIAYRLVPAVSWRALWSWRFPSQAWRALQGVWVVARSIQAWRPEAVVGFGGYGGALTMVIAKIARVPSVIHEQNVIPGRANRLVSRLADQRAVSFSSTQRWWAGRPSSVTGNPVRESILQAATQRRQNGISASGRLKVLVMGGSQGARSVNHLVLQAWAQLDRGVRRRLEVTHLTGRAWHEEVETAYRFLGMEATCVPFHPSVWEWYASVDLVIARAGATTIAELAVLGLPAILIPYPAAQRHQFANVQALVEIGACRCVEEGPSAAEQLAQLVEECLLNGEMRKQLSEAIRQFARPDAADRLAELVLTTDRA